MFRWWKAFIRRNSIIISIFITIFILLRYFLKGSSLIDDPHIMEHKKIIYNTSNSLVLMNLVDQFLDTDDFESRDQLWSIIIKGWLNSFEFYTKNTKLTCWSSSSSFVTLLGFLHQFLYKYTDKLFLNNKNLQRRLITFGIFFDYNLRETREKNHHILPNEFRSSCTYFELIVLIMNVQLVLFELNIDYFIGKNTLIGSLRHHDIVPWHSIVELNLPLNNKTRLLSRMNENDQLVLQQVNGTYVNKNQNGFIYKIFPKEKTWPQIEIYFYQENSTHIYDSYNDHEDEFTRKIGYLKKDDVFPLQIHPFGPILMHSIRHPWVMISFQKLNLCENLAWNHQLEKPIHNDNQRQILCEQLYSVYAFVETSSSRRRGYCEDTIKTKHLPYRTLSYLRYDCSDNLRNQL